jgi:integrase/recombinase XerD
MPSPYFSYWPARDQALWNRALKSGSPLDPTGGLSHLRSGSLSALRQAYRQWLHWLQSNEPETLQIAPEERATIERLHRWYDTMTALRPMSRLFYIEGTIKFLRAIAPEGKWDAHKRLILRLKRLAGRGDKSRKSGRILDSGALLEFGMNYANTSRKANPTPLEAAARYQTETMIAMLALMPLRSSTFRRLELGKSVHVGVDAIEITAPGETMKMGQPWDAQVPDMLLPLLRKYITEVRPWLLERLGKNHNFLWVTNKGDPFTNGYIGVRIAVAMVEASGVRVSPHLFRDAAATTLARKSPQSARLIKPVLAHSCTETSEDYYIHAGAIDAGRDYAALIKNLRKRT